MVRTAVLAEGLPDLGDVSQAVMSPAQERRLGEQIMREIQQQANEAARPLGVEVVDVRIRRADLPPETSQAIFKRMESERQREAAEAYIRSQVHEGWSLVPAKYDDGGYTGANIMVHGDCSSAGCFSMTDEQIAEIYAIARSSFPRQ